MEEIVSSANKKINGGCSKKALSLDRSGPSY